MSLFNLKVIIKPVLWENAHMRPHRDTTQSKCLWHVSVGKWDRHTDGRTHTHTHTCIQALQAPCTNAPASSAKGALPLGCSERLPPSFPLLVSGSGQLVKMKHSCPFKTFIFAFFFFFHLRMCEAAVTGLGLAWQVLINSRTTHTHTISAFVPA